MRTPDHRKGPVFSIRLPDSTRALCETVCGYAFLRAWPPARLGSFIVAAAAVVARRFTPKAERSAFQPALERRIDDALTATVADEREKKPTRKPTKKKPTKKARAVVPRRRRAGTTAARGAR